MLHSVIQSKEQGRETRKEMGQIRKYQLKIDVSMVIMRNCLKYKVSRSELARFNLSKFIWVNRVKLDKQVRLTVHEIKLGGR